MERVVRAGSRRFRNFGSRPGTLLEVVTLRGSGFSPALASYDWSIVARTGVLQINLAT